MEAAGAVFQPLPTGPVPLCSVQPAHGHAMTGHCEPAASACSGVKKTASLGSGGAGRPGWLDVQSPGSWADLHRKARQKAPAIQRARMATHFLGKSYDRKEMIKR